MVFRQLRAANLTCKPKKCSLAMEQVRLLGHVIGGGLIEPDPLKTEAISKHTCPVTKDQLRAFLGLAGYYRRFVHDFASRTSRLTDMTAKKSPARLVWTADALQQFEDVRQTLCSAPILRTPNFDRTFYLQTDASRTGLGAVLAQIDCNGVEYVVEYASRKLLPAERNCLVCEVSIQGRGECDRVHAYS